jgi:hypothetical protein
MERNVFVMEFLTASSAGLAIFATGRCTPIPNRRGVHPAIAA